MLSVHHHGQIHINKLAMKTYDLNRFKSCILFYDNEARCIGLLFETEPTKDYSFLLRPHDRGIRIAAKDFVLYFNIDKPQKFLLVEDKDRENFYIANPMR